MCLKNGRLRYFASAGTAKRGYLVEEYAKGKDDTSKSLTNVGSLIGLISNSELVSGAMPYATQLISGSIARLSKAKADDPQEIAASQLGLMVAYHQMALAQSRRSFNWALVGAGMGLLFFMGAAGVALHEAANTVAVVVPVVSGAVVEVVAGIVFILYGRTTVQLGEFHKRLERLQRYLLANSICEGLEVADRSKIRGELVREIAKMTNADALSEK